MAHPDREMCHICQARFVKAKGRCGTCYEYLRRHGRDRPEHLAARQPELNRIRQERQR